MRDLGMFTPGPTHVPLAIRMASIAQLAHHRSPEFRKLHDRVSSGLRALFRTDGDVFMLPASGSGAMEAVVSNIVRPGDTVLVCAAGKYGRRWAELCRTHQADVHVHEVPDGAGFDLDAVRRSLALIRPLHVFLTHCETSTGVVHDLQALAAAARRQGATVVADTMTSIGVEPFHMDAWGVDFALTASHKGLMSPPGAAFVAVAEQAWEKVRPAQGYSYWNLALLRENARESTVPNTPPTSCLFAVGAALDAIESEGLERVWERHARSAEVCRAGLGALGMRPFPVARPSAALTAVLMPDRKPVGDLVDELHHRFGIRVAGGQGALKGRIVRVGHIGSVDSLDLLPVVSALELLLLERGLVTEPGRGVAAMAAAMWSHQRSAVPVALPGDG
jgi:aspartate aminotransferase-like enzyme